MNRRIFFKFLDTGVMTKEYSDVLRKEVSQYTNAVKSGKGVKNIYSEEDDEKLFSRGDLIILLNSYLEEEILEWDLEYIVNFIELSFDVVDEKVEEVIFNFSDPYLGYPINSKNVEHSIIFMQDGTNDLVLYDDTNDKVLRSGYRSKFLK